MAARRSLAEDRTEDRLGAWEGMLDLLENAVHLVHRKPEFQVVMFPDVSDLFWGCWETQVPRVEIECSTPVEEMNHEPLGSVSGAFRGSQLNWPIVDKEGYAMVAAIKRLEYLMWFGG